MMTYLEVLSDLWSDLRLKLNPTEVVRRHLQDIIKLTDMLINRYFNAHFFIYFCKNLNNLKFVLNTILSMKLDER